MSAEKIDEKDVKKIPLALGEFVVRGATQGCVPWPSSVPPALAA